MSNIVSVGSGNDGNRKRRAAEAVEPQPVQKKLRRQLAEAAKPQQSEMRKTRRQLKTQAYSELTNK